MTTELLPRRFRTLVCCAWPLCKCVRGPRPCPVEDNDDEEAVETLVRATA